MTQKDKINNLENKTQSLEIYYATMSENLDNLCDKVDKIDKKLDSQEIKLTKRLDLQEKKFAGRWVEVVAVGALVTIIAQLALS